MGTCAQVTTLFGENKRAMIRGTLAPVADPRMLRCFDKLPWLQRPPVLQGHPVDPQIFI